MSEYKFDLSGGALCLNFSNTVGSHASDQPNEHLTSYADLVAWARQAGLFSERRAHRAMREAASRVNEANEVLRRAIAIRETVYRIFSAVAAGQEIAEPALDTLNETLSQTLTRLTLVKKEERVDWSWREEEAALDSMLWPVVRSAAELLTSENVRRVRECASDTCGWLFLDKSKNQSRRWCDMKSCGNAAKARRFYHQHKKAKK